MEAFFGNRGAGISNHGENHWAIGNLDCHYCYYLDKENLYPRAQFSPRRQTLEISQAAFRATPGKSSAFPGMRRADAPRRGVFRKAVELQKQYLPADTKIINGIQTNGTTSTPSGVNFSPKKLYIGLSLDGPRERTIITASPRARTHP